MNLIPARWTWLIQSGHRWTGVRRRELARYQALTADAIEVAVETMRVGWVDGEAPIGNVATVEIGW